MDNNIYVFEEDYSNKDRVKNPSLWYVVFLPLVGLLCEGMATNKYIAIAVWVAVLVLCPAICVKDYNILKEKGLARSGMKGLALAFPLLYMFQRQLILHERQTKSVMFLIFSVGALVFTSLSNIALINKENFAGYCQNYIYSSEIENLQHYSSDNLKYSADVFFSKYFSAKPKWILKEQESRNKYIVVCGGNEKQRGGVPVEIYFEIRFDGFCFQRTEITKIIRDGEQLSDKDMDDYIRKIFSQKINPNEYNDYVEKRQEEKIGQEV